MDGETLVAAAAANLAGWHESSVRALGARTSTDAWWWSASTPRPWIYFTAVGLRRSIDRAERETALEALRVQLGRSGGFHAVCDSFAQLDLARLGLSHRANGLWYARAPGALEPSPGRVGGEVTIMPVRSVGELVEFEAATCAAFSSPPPEVPLCIHGAGILDDPAMQVLVARDRHGHVVSGAMAYVDERVVGLYGVGTVPGHAGQGLATAVTTAVLALVPDRPAILQPSAEAAPLYRRLGFVEVGRFAHWG